MNREEMIKECLTKLEDCLINDDDNILSEIISEEHHSTNNLILDSSNSMRFQSRLILEAIEKLTLEVRELKDIVVENIGSCNNNEIYSEEGRFYIAQNNEKHSLVYNRNNKIYTIYTHEDKNFLKHLRDYCIDYYNKYDTIIRFPQRMIQLHLPNEKICTQNELYKIYEEYSKEKTLKNQGYSEESINEIMEQ